MIAMGYKPAPRKKQRWVALKNYAPAAPTGNIKFLRTDLPVVPESRGTC